MSQCSIVREFRRCDDRDISTFYLPRHTRSAHWFRIQHRLVLTSLEDVACIPLMSIGMSVVISELSPTPDRWNYTCQRTHLLETASNPFSFGDGIGTYARPRSINPNSEIRISSPTAVGIRCAWTLAERCESRMQAVTTMSRTTGLFEPRLDHQR